MKINYTVAQQFIARLLLIGLCLQSCNGGFDNNPIIPMGEEESPQLPTYREQQLIPQIQANIQPLIDQILTAEGGHRVTFYEYKGQLYANVESLDDAYKVYNGVPVEVKQGTDLASLPHLPKKIQQNRIHIRSTQGKQPTKVVIYKGAGLAGGMLEGEEEEAEDELADENIPGECFCSITQEIMEDPVIARDGHTYERQAIKRWFDMGKRTSPKTGARLLSTELIPNHTMRSLIQDIKAQVPVLARHKLDMRHIEAAIKLREEEIEEILAQKGSLIEEESQSPLNLKLAIQKEQKELEEKTALLSIMEERINPLDADKICSSSSSKESDIISQVLSNVDIDMFLLQAREGVSKILDAGNKGHVYAQFILGTMYEQGTGVSRNINKACEFYNKLAEQGHANAQYKLGRIYEDGMGVVQNYKEAAKWYKKAAGQGMKRAQARHAGLYYFGDVGFAKDKVYATRVLKQMSISIQSDAREGEVDQQSLLGWMYNVGAGIAQDSRKAFEWYEKAAEQGYAEAQNNLGAMYDNGEWVAQDSRKAFEWYEKAAKQGHAVAQNNLGSMYDNGKWVAQDSKKAFEWYEKAAEQGYAEAQNNLGAMYDNGEGVTQNSRKAFEWYEKAAKQGHAVAQNNLGAMYDNGEGVAQNSRKAFEWYEKAAEQGHEEAQFSLGLRYKFGIGITKEDKKAFEWYQKAAEQGHEEAQYMLGLMYENGEGVGKDQRKAFEWHQKAAEQGYPSSQFNLGLRYANGHGIAQDDKKAFEWLEKASKQDYKYAQFSLGLRYYRGKGVAKDYAKAFEWFQKAAEQGYKEAQYQLAEMYKYGWGVKKDKQKAKEWYEKAAK